MVEPSSGWLVSEQMNLMTGLVHGGRPIPGAAVTSFEGVAEAEEFRKSDSDCSLDGVARDGSGRASESGSPFCPCELGVPVPVPVPVRVRVNLDERLGVADALGRTLSRCVYRRL